MINTNKKKLTKPRTKNNNLQNHEILINMTRKIIKKQVPIVWKCKAYNMKTGKKFNREIKASKDAVFDKEYGWLCDCGLWTNQFKSVHQTLVRGIRDGV